MAKNITPRNENYSQWYHDVIAAGKLADYSPVKGCMVIRPTGFALWESVQSILDRMFKETGHVNAYFPLLIPESFIHKEAQHIEGFSPELAVVTHAGGKELEERLVVRPTSETIFGHMYAKWIQSYRDLPLKINQWCNVMRWEMRTRLFLRTSEFLWQEGHTAHATAEEAEEETLLMLDIYRRFIEEYMAIPVIHGLKSEAEKFPGAVRTYTTEILTLDKKALQSATSHNMGTNFARAFDIEFLDKNNKLKLAYTTSWGTSTRLIGGLIMTHADDDGLIVPPKIAPTKIAIVALCNKQEQRGLVAEKATQLLHKLKERFGLGVELDLDWDERPSDRFYRWIQGGVPLRLEIGLRDIEENKVIAVRRDNAQKTPLSVDGIVQTCSEILDDIQQNLYDKASQFKAKNTHRAHSYAQLKEYLAEGGFVEAFWNGDNKFEQQVKEEAQATIRCIAADGEEGTCLFSGKTGTKVIFAQAY